MGLPSLFSLAIQLSGIEDCNSKILWNLFILHRFFFFFLSNHVCHYIVFVGTVAVVCDRLALWVLWNQNFRSWQ